jgi:type III secretion protein J
MARDRCGRFIRRALPVAVLVGALSLAGCQDDLYSSLTEVEANQMLAVLMSNGINAEKDSKGKDGFTVTVDSRDMLRSIALLNDRGFPKNTRQSLGKVFEKSGIMSSPFEERVRFIYALGEELSQTLSQIDGVVTARVHIVLPDAPELGQAVKPSSAAVFIKHQPGTDLEFLVPQIRRLVSSSVEGLEYSAVTVVLTESQPSKQATTTAVNATVDVLPGVSVRDTDTGRFWAIVDGVGALIGVLLAVIIAGGIMMWRSKGAPRRKRGTALTQDPVVEPS